MAESAAHVTLVEDLVAWVTKTYLNGDKGFLLIDHPTMNVSSKPPKINGYVPDVFTATAPNGLTVIGEAKTIGDVERPHSVEQIRAFLKYGSTCGNSVFVFAVPWPMSRFARALTKRLQIETNSSSVSIDVIANLPC